MNTIRIENMKPYEVVSMPSGLPAKPVNYHKKFTSILTRLAWCYWIIKGRAIAVSYPEDFK